MEMTPLQVFRKRLWLYEEERLIVLEHQPADKKALDEIDANTERCVQEYLEIKSPYNADEWEAYAKRNNLDALRRDPEEIESGE